MVKKELGKIIQKAIEILSLSESGVVVESSADYSHGEYATNAALVCAKKSGKNPLQLAEEIKLEIEKQKSDLILKIEIAGPGFINIFLSDSAIFTFVMIEKNAS